MRKTNFFKLIALLFIGLMASNCKPTVTTVYRDKIVYKSDVSQLEQLISGGAVWPTGAPDNVSLDKTYAIGYRTSKEGLKDRYIGKTQISFKNPSNPNTITIDYETERQTMLGVGGSFTDATVQNLERLSPENRKMVYDAYFGANGSRYTLTRISLGSCDFSTKFYDHCHDPSLEDDKDGKASRDNTTPDPKAKSDSGSTFAVGNELAWFKLDAQDTDHIIPAVKKANEYVARYPDANQLVKHGKLTMFTAPWSPPAWMKGGGSRPGKTALAGTWPSIPVVQFTAYNNHKVKPEYYNAYAKYFVQFLKAYKDKGLEFYSLSLNNEAENHPAWEMCLWKPDDAKKFIKENLGPMLVDQGFRTKNTIAQGKITVRNEGLKFIVWDWDREPSFHADGFENWNKAVLSDAEVLPYVDGIAFHWYGGLGNAGTSWGRDFNLLQDMYDAYGVGLYASEACQENGPVLREWFPARRYIFDMINTFNNRTETWIDWNLLLDENGGPTHEVTNKCHAPIHVNFKGNNDPSDDEMIVNPAYYVLKRISLEARPGAKNLATTIAGLNTKDIFATAFKQTDGSVSLLVGNVPNEGVDSESNGKSYKFTVECDGQFFEAEAPADSLTVYKFKKGKFTPIAVPFTTTNLDKSLRYVKVAGGKFDSEWWNGGVKTVKSFNITATEITQGMYKQFMGENPVPEAQQDDTHPVYNISYLDAVRFCNSLSYMTNKPQYYTISGTQITINKDNKGFRLPTEDEWRWAAMGGTSGAGYNTSGQVYPENEGFKQKFVGYNNNSTHKAEDYAWFKDNGENKAHPVGEKEPNVIGLYDMSGNVAELTFGVISQGGSYKAPENEISINYSYERRGGNTDKHEDLGFRIVLEQ